MAIAVLKFGSFIHAQEVNCRADEADEEIATELAINYLLMHQIPDQSRLLRELALGRVQIKTVTIFGEDSDAYELRIRKTNMPFLRVRFVEL
jgi:hypothetical protein